MRFALLMVLLVLPLLAAFDADFAAWREWRRLTSLAANTALLAAIALVVALPLGTPAAVILSRGRRSRVVLGGFILALFVPLPVTAVAWQILLSLPDMGEVAWRPWAQGLVPAGIVHGFAAVPWVIAIVAAGLANTDRTLEEDALIGGGQHQAWRLVVRPRLALALLAATAWVLVQTSTEIPITDAMMVRTAAEEVYTQIVSGTGVRGAVALALPFIGVFTLIAYLVIRRVIRRTPINPEAFTAPPRWRFGWWQLYPLVLLIIVLVLPLLALMWKACGGGTVAKPSLVFGLEQLAKAVRQHGVVVLQSLLACAAVGVLSATLARWLAWQARSSRKFAFVVLLAAAYAFTPGPVLDVGWKACIARLVAWEERVLPAMAFPPLASLLYDQPSPLPMIVANALRWLPLALVIVGTAMRLLPRDVLETAAMDGADAWTMVVKPLTKTATLVAGVTVAALSLGEVSAGKLVAPPGSRTFILELFDQMHYGAEPTVAALALLQVFATAGVLGVGLVVYKTAGRVSNVIHLFSPKGRHNSSPGRNTVSARWSD